MEKLIHYLTETYHPLSIILYGSYADGTQNSGSDFDALVISGIGEPIHDTTLVSGVQLDVFVYPEHWFQKDFDCGDFIQLAEGTVIFDTHGIGASLKEAVVSYVSQLPQKSFEEAREEVVWCQKMLTRAGRGDGEGYYRWHWVLTDSLEIYCDLVGHRYPGPKKAIRWMASTHPDAYELYCNALAHFDYQNLEQWIQYLSTL